MTDNEQTSPPSCLSLGDTLECLRRNNVSRAQFGADGRLIQVDFFQAAPEAGDAPSDEQIVQTVVDQGLAFLAARGQRKAGGEEP